MILYLDPFAGASGDMFLGLLFDLGVPVEHLNSELGKLNLEGWTLSKRRETRRGIEGTRALVDTGETTHQRTWSDIDALVAQSPLDPETRELARKIFRKLGEAEAAIHGIPLEHVHFHEVGALDAIVDIVGSAISLRYLNPDQIICGPLPASSGTIDTSHGTVRIKTVLLPDGSSRWKVEHDDVVRLAEASGTDYLRLKTELSAEIEDQLQQADSQQADREE